MFILGYHPIHDGSYVVRMCEIQLILTHTHTHTKNQGPTITMVLSHAPELLECLLVGAKMPHQKQLIKRH